MILDIIVIVLLVVAVMLGKKTGLFKIVARLLSFILAWVFMVLFGEGIRTWLIGTPFYAGLYGRLTKTVEEAVLQKKTALIAPFMGEGTTRQMAEMTTQSIANSILTVLIFVFFLLAIRFAIIILDKTVFHLPLVRPVNQLTGILASLAVTLLFIYLAVGIVGGMAMCAENGLLTEQMEASKIVRFIYENNFVLEILKGKG